MDLVLQQMSFAKLSADADAVPVLEEELDHSSAAVVVLQLGAGTNLKRLKKPFPFVLICDRCLIFYSSFRFLGIFFLAALE